MAAIEEFFESDEIHPIDIVETLAEHHAWDFDRVGNDQIAMSVVGQWRTYSITLAWSDYDETLRLICTFEMEPPQEKLPKLYEALNAINDQCWKGGFTYWDDQRLMVWRYGLALSGGQLASTDQIDHLINAAVSACERYYPAFQLVSWGDRSIDDALNIAIAEAYGRA